MSHKTPREDASDRTMRAHELLDGPIGLAAMRLIEEGGILNLDHEFFEDLVDLIDPADEKDDAGALNTIDRIVKHLHTNSNTLPLAETLDSAITEAMQRRAERGYLLGLAVGRRLAPIGGAR